MYGLFEFCNSSYGTVNQVAQLQTLPENYLRQIFLKLHTALKTESQLTYADKGAGKEISEQIQDQCINVAF